MTESEAVAKFIEKRGVRRCPPRYAAATTAALSEPEAARRLAQLRPETGQSQRQAVSALWAQRLGAKARH